MHKATIMEESKSMQVLAKVPAAELVGEAVFVFRVSSGGVSSFGGASRSEVSVSLPLEPSKEFLEST